ncbi:hypothetical protein BLNAU_7166 [Blattamonas nauphoetae]|uniref:Secreted protein n=1 Tax=Blattamonas nauphoetae TaxID=2049346 RepID=A0ABQ9Y2K5_9EUKA|nr:hypothetical protein BLNAU_7166 [Blattamonas nauphoetae]
MILPFLFFYLGRQISGICVQIVTTVVKFLMDDIVQEYFMGIKKPRPFAEDFFTRLLKKILDKVSTVVNKETTVASPGDKGKNEEKPVTAEEAPPMKEPQRSRTETHED